MMMIRSTPLVTSLLLVLALALCGTTVVADDGCFDGSASRFHPDDWAYCQPITEDIFLYYTPFEEEANVMLGLHVTQDSFGWTALAMGGNGGMKGASQIVVRQNETGDWIAEDRYSMDYVMPTLDEQQDVQLLFAEQNDDGQTMWGVLVPINSCDEPFDYSIRNVRSYMHWALGSDHVFSYHGTRRGQFHANLLQAPIVDTKQDSNEEYVDMLMPNVPVVLGEGGNDPTNPYICTLFDLDTLSNGRYGSGNKVHITRFSPVLSEDSKQYVHHMILYGCSNEDDEDDDDEEWSSDEEDGISVQEREHLLVIPECESMPRGCYEMKWPWAVGGGDSVLPPHVGAPVGDGQRWVVLQTHYYNPNLDEGIVDNSGVRVYITEELREQEAGVLELNGGTSDWQRSAIPSGVAGYQLAPFVIPHGCTAGAWKGPLNVLGVIHHMHLYGTKMEITVERDGQNLGPIRSEHHYDFNHQSLEEPNPALATLLPGDQIIMNCTYDTSTATSDVTFGDLTQQEMCYSGIMYYPRQQEESHGYMTPQADPKQCLSPANETLFSKSNSSLCAQALYDNVPRFFGFEEWVPFPFGVVMVCNGGEGFADLRSEIEGLCPDTGCVGTANCTEEELALHAQAYCTGYCKATLNVSTYPDLSQQVAHDSGAWGCSEETQFFSTPMALDRPTCQKQGNMSQVVELKLYSGAAVIGGSAVSLFLTVAAASFGLIVALI